MPLDALTAALPTTQPNAVLLAASPEAQRDLEETAATDRGALGGLVTGVATVTGSAAAVAERALPTLVAGTFLVGVVLTAVFTFLAVLLLLAATRAERTQLAIRLRTMGLPSGRERLLSRAEVCRCSSPACWPGRSSACSPRLPWPAPSTSPRSPVP